MNIIVAVLTHNPLVKLRIELLEQTIKSVTRAFPNSERLLFDNGSLDGSHEEMLALTGSTGVDWSAGFYQSYDGNTTPGRGRREIMATIAEQSAADIVVFSDDDMIWKVGAEDAIKAFWQHAPNDVVLLCGFLEPNFHWSRPRDVLVCGGVKALVRDSVPGAAWTFRRSSWPTHLAPIVVSDFGYDHKACVKLKELGMRVAAVDLAAHEGWEASTHGNRENRCALPIDKDKWGLA